jgi:hypothetical protein
MRCLSDRLVLVQGRVVKVVTSEDNTKTCATVRITKVYCGAKELLGESFFDMSGIDGTFATSAQEPFIQGEVGIWSLGRDRLGRLFAAGIPDLPFACRARANFHGRYDQVREVAEAIERIQATKPSQEVGKLWEHVLSATPEVAGWAVRTIAANGPGGMEKRFEHLILDRRTSIGGQVAIDEVLCTRQGERWYHSPARLELLGRWAVGRWDNYEAGLIISRFESIAGRAELGALEQLKLLHVFMTNTMLSVQVRKQGCAIVPRISDGDDDEVGFNLLVFLVREGDARELREEAAFALARFRNLNKGQLSLIRAMRATTKDQRVIRALEDTIDQWENGGRREGPR